jgi:ATP-binding cassette subfamily B protein/subfamily B ATP-binding cassette protein MsbA
VVAGEIRLSGVHFGYRQGHEVLRGVDLVVRRGEAVALIGPSGAGKTTLLNLLPRFFDPGSGAVFLDGADLRSWPLTRLREQIAVVLQEPILLPASIAENIAYGRPGASLEEIMAAARAAHADSFIQRLGDGYQTMVGEGAARLSVGEKQRINLARAFLKNAPVLLLDEPTSALDGESESMVLSGLKELMKGRTTIMVAHRLATIEAASRIVVLAGGRVEESGSQEELLGRNGYYARLRGEAGGPKRD